MMTRDIKRHLEDFKRRLTGNGYFVLTGFSTRPDQNVIFRVTVTQAPYTMTEHCILTSFDDESYKTLLDRIILSLEAFDSNFRYYTKAEVVNQLINELK